MCNRTDCAGSWAGPMACARCREVEMAIHTVITLGRLEDLERAERENMALRKKVEALEWLLEVKDFNFWNSKRDVVSKFTPQFANASREYDRTYYHALEATK